MSPPYDHAGLAAVTVTRLAAEESEGPGPLSERMRRLVLDLLERSGPDGVADLVIELARQHFVILDVLAECRHVPTSVLLDEEEIAAQTDE